jgi:triosephosphate isomerase
MRKISIAGNWKMHKTLDETALFLDEFLMKLPKLTNKVDIVIAAAFTSLALVKERLKLSPVYLSAQTVSQHLQGAYTGDISIAMLKSCGCTHCIIGHSERRKEHNEHNHLLNKKLALCLENSIIPIYCVGESLAQREDGQTLLVIETQLKEGLRDIAVVPDNFIIAYEPVWAIGTGKVASPEQANEVHAFIRHFILENYGASVANNICILYGGSVKAENIDSLLEKPDIDGALVGGASLDASEFLGIIQKSLELKRLSVYQ